jgi:hypothetical protein
MDARIFSMIRRDGTTLYKLNVFASIFIVLCELVLVFIFLILIKLNTGLGVLILFAVLLVGIPIGVFKFYKRRFKYYSVVRLKDIIYEIIKPKRTRCQNAYRQRPVIVKINIAEARKHG